MTKRGGRRRQEGTGSMDFLRRIIRILRNKYAYK